MQYNYDTQSVENRASLKIDAIARSRNYHLQGRPSRDRIVIGFTTASAISAYHHKRRVFESDSWRGVLDTTLCDIVCQ